MKACSSRKCTFSIIFIFVLLGIVAALAPSIVARRIPTYLQENVSPYISVEHADISLFPPAVYLHGVHFKNPEGFDAGDAVTIGKLTARLDSFISSPLRVQTVIAQDVQGRFQMVDDVDNFSPLIQSLMENEMKTPQEWAAKEAVVEGINIRNSHLKNVAESVAVKLEDDNMDAIGTTDAPVTIHKATIEVFKTVLLHEQGGVIHLVAKGVGDKAKDTIKSIGDAIKGMVE